MDHESSDCRRRCVACGAERFLFAEIIPVPVSVEADSRQVWRSFFARYLRAARLFLDQCRRTIDRRILHPNAGQTEERLGLCLVLFSVGTLNLGHAYTIVVVPQGNAFSLRYFMFGVLLPVSYSSFRIPI